MPIPQLKSFGAGANNGSPAWGTHAKDDIGLMIVQTANQAVTESSGFTETPGSPQGTGTAGAANSNRLTAFWKRAGGSSEPNGSLSGAADHTHSKITVFSGCKKTGSPIHAYASGNDGTLDTALAAIGPLTTVPNCLIVILATTGIDKAPGAPVGWAGNWSGESAPNLGTLTEQFDSGITTGVGGGIAMWTGTLADAGQVGSFSAIGADATADAWLILALEPPPPVLNNDPIPARIGPFFPAGPGAGGAFPVIGAGPTGIVLLGSDVAGPYISRDRGASWRALGPADGIDQTHISAVGFHPTDPNRMFIGSEHGLFLSTDSGLTWTRVTDDLYVTSVMPAPSNPSIVYCPVHPVYNSTTTKLLKSTDGGSTFVEITTNLPTGLRITKCIVDHTDPNTVYLVSAGDKFVAGTPSLWRSTDGGPTFTQKGASLGNIWDMAMDPVTATTIYVTTYSGTLFSSYTGTVQKSTDRGDNWSQIHATHSGSILAKRNDASTIGVFDAARDPGNSEEGWWESTTAGASWTTPQKGVLGDWGIGWQDTAQAAFGRNQYGTAKALGLDLFDPNTIWMVNSQYVYKSTDFGQTFVDVFTLQVSQGFWRTRGAECLCVLCAAFSEADPNLVYIGCMDIGMHRSLDKGVSFQTCNNAAFTGAWVGHGGNTTSIIPDPARAEVVWATTGDTSEKGTVVRSANKGHRNSWVQATGLPALPAGSFCYGMSLDRTSPTNSRRLFLTAGGDVYRSVNDGVAFSAVDTGHSMRVTAVDEFDGNLVYAGGEGGMRRSLDGGDTWAPIGPADFTGAMVGTAAEIKWTGIQGIAVDPNVSGRVYVAVHGTGKGHYRSDDKGATWTKIRLGDFARAIAVNPKDSNILYATSSKAYKAGSPPSSAEGLIRSLNGGATWSSFNDNLPWPFAGPIALSRN